MFNLIGPKPTGFLHHNQMFDVIITFFNYDIKNLTVMLPLASATMGKCCHLPTTNHPSDVSSELCRHSAVPRRRTTRYTLQQMIRRVQYGLDLKFLILTYLIWASIPQQTIRRSGIVEEQSNFLFSVWPVLLQLFLQRR